MNQIPPEFLPYLGPFGVQVVDKSAGVPVGYGYPIIGPKLGEEAWARLGQYGKQVFVNPGPQGYWALITKVLTRSEAEQQFGPLTKVEYGPRGGWKSTVYGQTRFTNTLMKIEKT